MVSFLTFFCLSCLSSLGSESDSILIDFAAGFACGIDAVLESITAGSVGMSGFGMTSSATKINRGL